MQFSPCFLLITGDKPCKRKEKGVEKEIDPTLGWQEFLISRYGKDSFTHTALPQTFFDNTEFSDWHLLKQYFAQLVRFINEKYKSPEELRSLVVFVPVVVESPLGNENQRWNPCNFHGAGSNRTYHREMLFAWLFLAFPEIRFVFYKQPVTKRKECETEKQPREPSDLHLFNPYEPLNEYVAETDFLVIFDPSGWRNAIRETLAKDSKAFYPPKDHPVLFGRDKKNIAVVIEDEKAFSFFYGYTAYRNGTVVWIARSMRQLNTLFGKENEQEKYKIEFHISIEDLNLGLQDKPSGTHLSNIAKKEDENVKLRGDYLPGTKKIKNRFLVSYGKTPRGSEPDATKTRLTLRQQRREYNRNNKERTFKVEKIIYKPLVSVSKLSKDVKLNDTWKDTLEEEKKNRPQDRTTTSGGHSASGMISEIARILLDRADRFLSEKDANLQAVPDLFHAALLALEAKELLGGRTPTLFIEALAMQHKAETLAECRCYGTDYELDVKSRVKEIHKEVDSICKWYRKDKKRTLAALSTEQIILNEVAGIYRDFHQIDEYGESMTYVRALNRELYYRHKQHYFPVISEMVYGVRWYFEKLQKSTKNFFVFLAVWYIVMYTLWTWTFIVENTWNWFDLLSRFWGADPPSWFDVKYVDQLQLRDSDKIIALFGCQTVLWLPFIIGLFHLGYLLTALFEFVQRKD